MKRPTKTLLLAIAIVSMLFACQKKSEQNVAHPNILLILADDLGMGDVSALNPNSKIKTPYIDRLSQEGITFMDAHSNSAVCTPTRYGILTGQYCWRSRIKKGVLLGYSPSLIEPETPTIASMLQKKGYTTACIGKWHLGVDFALKDGGYHQGEKGVDFTSELIGFKDYQKIEFEKAAKGGPLGAGFEYSFILPASLDFQPYMYMENNRTIETPSAFTPGNDLNAVPWATGAFWREGQMAPSFSFEGVLPTFTQKAVDFLEKQEKAEKPFFLYFPMNAPHTPWVPSDEFKGSSGAGSYGDFVQMVDHEVGKLLQALNDLGLDKNTIVIFTSDNGAYWRTELKEKYDHKANLELRGMKADIWEGGHRVPFFIRYPGKTKAGEKVNETISLTDFFASFQAIVRDESETAKDSYSFIPLLEGKTEDFKRGPVIHHSSSCVFAIRDKEWKYIEGLGSGGFTKPTFPVPTENGPKGQLYNLNDDPFETNNLYLQNPEKVEEMHKMLKEIRGY